MKIHRLRHGGLIAAAIACVASFAATACDNDDLLTPEERATAIRTLVQLGVLGGDRILRAGHDTRVNALVTDIVGLPIEGAGVTWSTAAGSGSVAADAAETDADGRSSGTWTLGTTAGVQEIVAAVDGRDLLDRTDVVVFPDSVVGSLTLVSARATIVTGDTTRVVVTDARDQYGNAYVLAGVNAANPPPIEFTSLDPAVATLRSTNSRSALIVGAGAGTARIEARSDGKADTVTVDVTP